MTAAKRFEHRMHGLFSMPLSFAAAFSACILCLSGLRGLIRITNLIGILISIFVLVLVGILVLVLKNAIVRKRTR